MFNVTWAAWRLVDHGRLLTEGALGDVDCLALLLAAACHDLGHPVR